MLRFPICAACTLVLVAAISTMAGATPSSTFFTNCTIDIQAAGVSHLGVDDYFGLGAADASDVPQFATDIGPEWGAKLTKKLAAEYGFDVFGSPVAAPFFVNTKVGYRENVLSPNAMALQLGLFGFGMKAGDTNGKLNVIQLITGKTLPNGKTRLMASAYYGNPGALRSGTGSRQNVGYMVALDHQIVPGKWVFAADYCSGNNAIGGGGFGVYYYFTKDISLLAGPVWFNDPVLNGSTKASVQLDINF